MAKVIDLTTSSPPAAAAPILPPSVVPTKRGHSTCTDEDDVESEENEDDDWPSDADDLQSEEEQEPLEVPIPTLEHLAEIYLDREELFEHLITLPKPLLSAMLMRHLPSRNTAIPESNSESEAQPKAQPKAETANTLAHCVYCHKIYDKRINDLGCKVEHWGEFDGDEFTCCGLYVYYVYEKHPPPEDQEPYCYTGPHRDRLINEGGSSSEKGDSWWSSWEDSGNTCDDMRCEEELQRFAGARKPVLKKARK